MVPAPRDVWSSGDAYEGYIGRWSRPVAKEFIRWLEVEPAKRWLDVGCGTGALTGTVLAFAEPASVDGIDPSEVYIQENRLRIADRRASFEVADAMSLPAVDGTYDAVAAGLVLNFVSDPAKAVSEMARVAVPDGVVAAYVWDYAGDMQLIRYFWDAAVALDPAARSLDEGVRFPLCKPEPLRSLFSHASLKEVEVRKIVAPTTFADFDDYWTPFLGGQGPAPGYALSLGEERRTRLREHLHSLLPIEDDGSVHLTARAWAVRGRRGT